jgi:hypothetical protein
MNTQTILHEHSDAIPEGLYLKLMNSLKKDFDADTERVKVKVKLVVFDRKIPRHILMCKNELHKQIIEKSTQWPDREQVLCDLVKMDFYHMLDLCKKCNLPYMKKNPRWTNQATTLDEVRRQLVAEGINADFLNRL